MLDPEDAKKLQDLLNLEDGLSEWEVEFIESLSKYLKNTYKPSTKQLDKIRELYEKHC